ncbi:MAG TPA: hypothetical protein VGV37_28580 [Aliidongia sp.]|uniref:hypothetical protein n=1 Tax=Aliidongia sp. TaxID=1914230 RepID=UPI002DDCB010|nr:hypothetical protein [Aliidongia sp.]HEV2678516.1 hypothetical protein [Aliidongia sp.]
MRRIGLVVLVVLVLVGGGYWGASAYSNARLRAALDQSLQRLPSGYVVTYKTATYSLLSGKAEIGGIETHLALGSGPFDGTVALVELVRPNLALADRWNEAVANPASWPLDKVLPVADSIVIEGIHVTNALQTIDVDSQRLDGIRLYPGALLHPGLPSLSDVVDASHAGAQPSPETLLKLARFEAALILGIGCDRQAATNMRATGRIPASDTVPELPFSYELPQASVTGLDRGIWQDMSGERLSFSGPSNSSVKVGRFGFSGFDVRQLATRLLDATEFSRGLLDGLSIKRIDYADFSVQTPEGGVVPMEGFSLSDIVIAQGEPVSATFVLKGLGLDRSRITEPSVAAVWDQIGVDHLTVGAGFALNRDVASGHASIHDTFVKIDELGSLDLTAEVSDEPLGGSPLAAKLTKAALHYRDASLADRVLKLMAQGGDPEQARNQLIQLAQQQAAELGPSFGPAGEALAAFFKQPKQLTVELAPAQPIPFATLAGLESLPPPEAAALLGLTIRANE